MNLTKELRQEYVSLYNTIEVENKYTVTIARKILANKSRYIDIETLTKVPWYVVASIHSLEASLDFNKNLHNGERWNRKTKLVPKGVGPFASWEESAVDAIERTKKHFGFEAWYIPEICYMFEAHNGWGYRRYHSHVLSPYLWAGSNHYKTGKYVADGKWSDSAVSRQIGAMCLIKQLAPELESTKIENKEVESIQDKPVIVKPHKHKKRGWWRRILNWLF